MASRSSAKPGGNVLPYEAVVKIKYTSIKDAREGEIKPAIIRGWLSKSDRKKLSHKHTKPAGAVDDYLAEGFGEPLFPHVFAAVANALYPIWYTPIMPNYEGRLTEVEIRRLISYIKTKSRLR